jgi:hypothetical protein
MPTSVPASASSPRPSFRANAGKRSLLAQAPTGIGKTVGTLFPVLKAAPKQELDKLFFLAAKTPGRQLALDAAATLKSRRQPARCACSNWPRATRPASIPTRPAAAIPARWPRASTTACRERARRR